MKHRTAVIRVLTLYLASVYHSTLLQKSEQHEGRREADLWNRKVKGLGIWEISLEFARSY